MEVIIVQAGGRGSRMEHLTANKPKALVPVDGAPLILHLMRRFPAARFVVIADYQRETLAAYLRLYSPAKVDLVSATGQGNCSGIAEALELVPPGVPFALIWCDLYCRELVLPSVADHATANWIGLADAFPCRWRFKEQELREEPSTDDGVGGVFVFKDKAEIADVPPSGEFCDYLAQRRVPLRPFPLMGVVEIGSRSAHEAFVARLPRSRPFNDLRRHGATIEKRPRDAKGRELARYERSWYEATRACRWDFIPGVRAVEPLTLEWIDGLPLHQAVVQDQERSALLVRIIGQLDRIHAALPPRPADEENDREAITGKTYRRLASIRTLLPDMDADTFLVNGHRCLNFFKHWDLVETMAARHRPQDYRLLHGDPTFSNMLRRSCDGHVFFIDPRGYYGRQPLYGDIDYDWAKLYYSLVGNYDPFNNGRFRLDLGPSGIRLEIASNGWEHLRGPFFRLTGCDERKTEFLHAIIWLSLASYTWDDYDAICAAFFNGILHMQHCHEREEEGGPWGS